MYGDTLSQARSHAAVWHERDWTGSIGYKKVINLFLSYKVKGL